MTWRQVMRSLTYQQLPKDSPFRTYVRIMEANERGAGIRLSADETAAIAIGDDAVYFAAENIRDEAATERHW